MMRIASRLWFTAVVLGFGCDAAVESPPGSADAQAEDTKPSLSDGVGAVDTPAVGPSADTDFPDAEQPVDTTPPTEIQLPPDALPGPDSVANPDADGPDSTETPDVPSDPDVAAEGLDAAVEVDAEDPDATVAADVGEEPDTELDAVTETDAATNPDASEEPDTAVPPECELDEDCPADAMTCHARACVLGLCAPVASPGAPCDDGNGCTEDGCDAGTCTHTPAAGACSDGNPCTSQDFCADGTCSAGENTCACIDDSDCAVMQDSDVCNGSLVCEKNDCVIAADSVVTCATSEDTACRATTCAADSGLCATADLPLGTECDDGLGCTTDDACSAGLCSGTSVCDDGNVCTIDTCGLSGCVHTPRDGGCSDGSLCTEDDACQAGTCTGTPRVCVDDNPCTTDGCIAATGCAFLPAPGPCNDGNACTDGDGCAAGSCVPGSAVVCSDGDVCTIDQCDPASGCAFTAGPPCDDQNVCTDDDCDAKAGCRHLDNTVTCDDGDACTIDDTCAGAKCIASPRTCADDTPCTDDGCDSATGCRFDANDNRCDDGDLCTSDDTCADSTCQGGGAVACDDGNPCTTDRCEPALGCATAPTDGGCSDGDACTDGDHCAAGACQPGASVCACQTNADCLAVDDQNPCTPALICNVAPDKHVCEPDPATAVICDGAADTACAENRCQPETGACAMVPVHTGSPCNDGSSCTLDDACSSGVCSGKPSIPCDDGNPCTNDGCDAAAGCTTTPNSAACDDGDSCTLADACAAGVCAPGPRQPCADGDACTTDSCVSGIGCLHDAAGALCDDGNPCTDDACNPELGCTHAPHARVLGPCNTGAPGVCDAGRLHCQNGSSFCMAAREDLGSASIIAVPAGTIERNGGLVGGGETMITSNGRHLFNVAHSVGGGGYNGWTWRLLDPANGFQVVSEGSRTGSSFYADGYLADDSAIYPVEWTGVGVARVARIDLETGDVSEIGLIEQFDYYDSVSPISGQYDWVNGKFWLGSLMSGTAQVWPVPFAPGMPGTSGAPALTTVLQGVAGAGVLMTDGTYLYAKRWAGYPGDDTLRRLGTGYNGTTTGAYYGTVPGATAAFGLSGTYHPDGRIYIPMGDGANLQAIVVTASSPELCNDVDDDCNGLVDDGCRSENDRCSEALPILDRLDHPFDTRGATSAGPDEPVACGPMGSSAIESDVWFSYAATCGGTLTLDTCGSGLAARVALYAGSACPTGDIGGAVACAQDSCGEGALSATVTLGQKLLIRVGGLTATEVGKGLLDVTCTSRCGDSVVDTELGEACDDGNAIRLDGCSDTCQLETCGDGLVQGNHFEACDDGAGNSDTTPNACRSNCVPAHCGDGVVDGVEQCDAGQDNSDTLPNVCRKTCRSAGCGDTVIDDGEECDDGNSVALDGCSETCRNETCGDGVVSAGEDCDDGAQVAGDGCDADCKTESCGDGVMQAGLLEECDQGVNGSATCTAECRTITCSTTETCNGKDDDCDGVVDDDPSCTGPVVSYLVNGSATVHTKPLPSACLNDYDCGDENIFTVDTCKDGTCAWSHAACDGPDEDACTDGRHVTQGGGCVDTGPLLLWDFEEAPTVAVLDLSGSDSHGEPHGGKLAAAGKFGNAFHTDEGKGWVDVRTSVPETDFTLAVWFKTNQLATGLVGAYAGGVPRASGTKTDRQLHVLDGRLGYRVSPGLTSHCDGQGPLVNDGAWHHAALVCESGIACRMLLDGAELCRSKYFDAQSKLTGTVGLVLGWTEIGGARDVQLDHLALFGFPMTGAEVQSLMTNGVLTRESGSNMERCNGKDMDCSGVPNDTCTNSNLCSVQDQCSGSTCLDSLTIACAAPESTCEQAACDARNGACATSNRVSGASCNDGSACTSGDTCDGNGRCAGTGACLGGSAWFPNKVIDAQGKDLGKDIIIYDMTGAPELGCLVPVANETGAFGKWKKVQGTTDSWYHQGTVGFGVATKISGLDYRCVDVKWVLTSDLTVGLSPFTIGGKITVPFPDVGFSSEMALSPPPVHVNAPYLALGIQSGASLSYLQAPLQPDRDYFFLSGLFGANLTFPGALPIPFPGTKSVDIVFDPFDPMFHLGLGGLLEFPVGPTRVGLEALSFSNHGQLLHKGLIPLWFGAFKPNGDLKFEAVSNNAHGFAQVSVAFKPFKTVAEYTNGVGDINFTFTGRVSVGLDAKGDGFGAAGGSTSLFDALFKGSPSSSAGQPDIRTLADGNLAFKIPLKKKQKKINEKEPDRYETLKAPKALGGKDIALGFALAQSTLLIDTTPGSQVVALRARTTKMPWEGVPVLGDLLQSFNFKLDIAGYWKEVNGASSGGVAIEVVTPTPFRIPGIKRGIPFKGQIYVDSVSGFRIRGSLDFGRFDWFGASFVIGELGPVEASWDGEKFCLGAAVTVPKSFEKEGGGTENTTCTIVPCFGKNGFDGSRLQCAPFCFADSECPASQACIWGSCKAKLANAAACSTNGACASGHCFSGFCVECWPGQSECGDGQFCDNAGYCQSKGAFGTGCIGLTEGKAFFRNDWCQSGKCDTTCVDCYAAGPLHKPLGPLAYTDTCGTGKFCDAVGACKGKLAGGDVCLNVKQSQGIDYWCKSDDCDDVTAICRDCGTGAKQQCSATQYCLGYGCQDKVADGTLCLSPDVCLSGQCTLGVSTTGGPASYCYTEASKSYDAACKVNPECKSGACRATDGKCSCNFDHALCPDGFCDGVGFCQPKWELGHACLGDVECDSGHCAGVCIECTTHDHCDGETWCAADGSCRPKAEDGTTCLTDIECQSGTCGPGIEKFCYTADSQDYGETCHVQAECKSGQCLAGDRCGCAGDTANCDAATQYCDPVGYCQTKLANTTPCTADEMCQSGKCPAGYCVECLGDGDCSGSQFCDVAGFCQAKLALDAVCAKDSACTSGICVSVCIQCKTHAHCGASEWCAADGRCKPQAVDGTTCLGGVECTSGQCGAGIEKFCYTPASKTTAAACKVQAECQSGQCLALGTCGCANSHSNCSAAQYCDPAGYCQTKLGNSTPCTAHEMCQSGRCPAGVCVQCAVDGQCTAGQFCDVAGYCQSKLALGAVCTRDFVCASSMCVSVCIQCKSHADCGSTEWCAADSRCKPKAADATVCLTNVECASGQCGTGVEKFCYTPNSRNYGATCKVQAECKTGQCLAGGTCGCAASNSNCGGSQYCDVAGFCQNKLGTGGVCANNSYCQSGKCPAGYCAECLSDGECTAGKFCDAAGVCQNKLALGAVCAKNSACASSMCASVCIQCTTNSHCAGTEWCAADGRCKPKAADGTACLTAVECVSGNCGSGVEKFCYTPNSKAYAASCKVQAECQTGQCLAAGTCGCNGNAGYCGGGQFCNLAGTCQNKLVNGSVCTANNFCQSGKCPAGYCVQCLSDGECSGGQFCDAAGYCQNKLAYGATCIKDSACSSGLCSGVCVNCKTNANCGSGQFCDGFNCQNKKGLGATCLSNAECAKGQCAAGICGCNYADENCPGGQYCSAAACFNKGAGGALCGRGGECQSGACNGGVCGCANNSQCGSTQYCSGSTCTAKLAAGAGCSTGGQCISGNCQGVNCNGYECGCTTCYGPCWYAPWLSCGYTCGCTTCYNTCYQCTLF